MASSYSPLLRFELIAAGEQAGLWGNTTNNNIGTLLEQAIAGVTAIALSGSANYTLSSTNGTPDEARAAVLSFSGAPSTAINIIVPASQKWYIAKNGSTQTLTFKTAAQVGGVAVLAGGSTVIFCDGTSVYSAIEKLQLAQGGTGATNAADARTSLGVPGATGSGASGTWGISITGNAATATLATTATTANTANALAGGIDAANIMTLTGTQSATGTKNFLNPVRFGTADLIDGGWATVFYSYASNPAQVIYAIDSGSTGSIYYRNTPGRMHYFLFGTPGGATTECGSITVNGSQTFYNTISDYRLKENVKSIESASDQVMRLKPRTFTWRQNPELGEVHGFIAHEVQEVIPQAVTGIRDGVKSEEQEDGRVRTVPDYQAMDASHLVPVLTAALQEALGRIRRLEETLYG